ncbi:MAG: DoxX family membrane protein [Alteromonadaceae bacterium]|nr:DoxX family membrane protein [Alteromonadaceae bacterium]
MQQFQKILATQSELAPLVLRIVAGIIFAAYGAQKLFAWFGGYGLEGTGQFFDSIGLSPGYYLAMLAGSAEFFGGLALIVGVLVRPAALALTFTMIIAIVTVHLENGLFMANNGYAFALTLLAMSFALVFTGAGKLGVDGWLNERLSSL